MTEPNEVSISRWLGKAMWPWPLALAYMQGPARDSAVAAVVEVFDTFSQVGDDFGYPALAAVHRIFEVASGGGEAERVDYPQLDTMERELRGLIEAGSIESWGRDDPAAPLRPIRRTDWIGAEVDSEKTSDLVVAGWRKRRGSLPDILGEVERKVWHYDIHLLANEVRQAADSASVKPLRFVPMGRPLIDPLDLSTALNLATFGVATGDIVAAPSGKIIQAPFKTEKEGQVWAQRLVVGRLAIQNALSQQHLSSFVADPQGNAWRIDRQYWWRCPSWLEGELTDGLGVPPEFYGAMILVDPDDLPQWELVARTAIARIVGDDVTVANPSPPAAPAVIDLAVWADDAASRNVTIAEARDDALAVIGSSAPRTDLCREALRAARQRRGTPTRRGRPKGAKSFAKAIK